MVYFNEKIKIHKKFDYLEEMMYNLNRGEIEMKIEKKRGGAI